MSKYLIHHPDLGVLCKPPRAGKPAFWESPLGVARLKFPSIVGVMTWDTLEGAQQCAELNGGFAKPITEVFDASVILTPP